MNQFNAQMGVVLDDDGDIDLLMPVDDEVLTTPQGMFLMSIYHRCCQEPEFYKNQIEWFKEQYREFEGSKRTH